METTASRGQMSEAFCTVAFLSVSGGWQDAYTYIQRGSVFANAQTGNIVLMSDCLFTGELGRVPHYLFPVLAFALGVAAAESIRLRFGQAQRLHWRQGVLAAEILLLLTVGFLPAAQDTVANALVSFACAMQVQAFRKVCGCSFASTMCIGNLRSGMEALVACLYGHNKSALRRAGRYFGVILFFALGAGLGARAAALFGARAIWGSCGLLCGSLCLMFVRNKEAAQG